MRRSTFNTRCLTFGVCRDSRLDGDHRDLRWLRRRLSGNARKKSWSQADCNDHQQEQSRYTHHRQHKDRPLRQLRLEFCAARDNCWRRRNRRKLAHSCWALHRT
jgi:hypothetical protein